MFVEIEVHFKNKNYTLNKVCTVQIERCRKPTVLWNCSYVQQIQIYPFELKSFELIMKYFPLKENIFKTESIDLQLTSLITKLYFIENFRLYPNIFCKLDL